MFLRVEKASAVPISRQIAQQIATLCASGSLAAGERLPSVRELATDLAVNQNTVLRVYDRLCRDGLLEMRHGQGTFVGPDARANASPGQRARLVDELRQLAQQGVSLGLTPEQLHEMFAEAIGQTQAPAKSNHTASHAGSRP